MNSISLSISQPALVPEGSGALARRIIGLEKPRVLDPFVLLDHFTVSKPNGFPDHPHRGFQLVTYCLSGSLVHEDSLNNKFTLNPGDVMCLTAGIGVLHALVPTMQTCEGIQLWVNIPARDKFIVPRCEHVLAQELPMVATCGYELIVVSGSFEDMESPITTMASTTILDIKLAPGSWVQLPCSQNSVALLYVLIGSLDIDSSQVTMGQTAHVLCFPGFIPMFSDVGARVLVFIGKPINEEIIRHGPFVMNSRSEVMKAARDFNLGENGFEQTDSWRSECGLHMFDL